MADKNYYAHTDPDGKLLEEGEHWQLLENHLLATAELAKAFASAFDAGEGRFLP